MSVIFFTCSPIFEKHEKLNSKLASADFYTRFPFFHRGALASWLGHLSPDQVVWVLALARYSVYHVLCS